MMERLKKLFALLMALLCVLGTAGAETYHAVFYGDWDQITNPAYQAEMAVLFATTYPRLYARWGMGDAPTTIYLGAEGADAVDEADEGVVAYSYGARVVLSVDYANANRVDRGYIAHELAHSVQCYDGKLNYGGDAWWTENLANYAGFRYYHWADIDQMEPSSSAPEDWMDWDYAPYGNGQWFFAYMDARYPTTLDAQGQVQYGLIDAIHRLIRSNEGEKLDDDPYDTQTPINQLVRAMTGYASMEELRLRYVQELRDGTWTFTGFADYPDNFLTENLPGVADPTYPAWEQAVRGPYTAAPMEALTDGENLCRDAVIAGASGYVRADEAPEMLIDGDSSTKWCSRLSDVTGMKHCMDGTKQWIIIDLGAEKAFNTYTILNTHTVEPYYGNMVSWELFVSSDGESWVSVDTQQHCDADAASFAIGQQSARYLLLKIADPDNGEADTIRLYEFMLFNR